VKKKSGKRPEIFASEEKENENETEVLTSVEKNERKQMNFYAKKKKKKSEINKVLFSNQPTFCPSVLVSLWQEFDEVSKAINNILVKIRGRILLKREGMMRIKKLHQRIHFMFQLGQLQGAKRINEAFNDGLILNY